MVNEDKSAEGFLLPLFESSGCSSCRTSVESEEASCEDEREETVLKYGDKGGVDLERDEFEDCERRGGGGTKGRESRLVDESGSVEG